MRKIRILIAVLLLATIPKMHIEHGIYASIGVFLITLLALPHFSDFLKTYLPKQKNIVTGIIIIAIIGFSGNVPIKETKSSYKAKQGTEIEAYNFATQFIKEKLKTPSTAKFPNAKLSHATHIEGGKYEVTSYVDSQNSFGATLRSNWSCTIIFENGKIKAENIVIEN